MRDGFHVPLISHRSSIEVEAFAADGTTLSTASNDGAIIVWSVPDLNRQGRLPKASVAVGSLAVSPGGRSLVAGYQDRVIRPWDVPSGMELATAERRSGTVVREYFSPDRLTLAACAQPAADRIEIVQWRATGEK